MGRSALSVYEYLDYRSYLRDYYVDRKKNGRGFSYRSFSRRANLRSPNYLKMVMDGQRNLTPAMAERFSKALGLEGEEADYFVDLVAFNQAKTSHERNKQYERIMGSRKYRKAHRLDIAQAAYHSTWYIPAIRELAAREDFRDDPEWIAKTLVPPISKAEAKRAVTTLVELGLLVREGNRVSQGQELVSTGPETRSLHIANYHRSMIERAAEAIDLFPSHDRDISSLTLCMGADGVKRLKERVQKFRGELLELSTHEQEPNRVVQVNFQLFPLSAADEENADD
jgi:uncharacterized protein (TIGR02147 family)